MLERLKPFAMPLALVTVGAVFGDISCRMQEQQRKMKENLTEAQLQHRREEFEKLHAAYDRDIREQTIEWIDATREKLRNTTDNNAEKSKEKREEVNKPGGIVEGYPDGIFRPKSRNP